MRECVFSGALIRSGDALIDLCRCTGMTNEITRREAGGRLTQATARGGSRRHPRLLRCGDDVRASVFACHRTARKACMHVL